jgi:hypothetical protein
MASDLFLMPKGREIVDAGRHRTEATRVKKREGQDFRRTPMSTATCDAGDVVAELLLQPGPHDEALPTEIPPSCTRADTLHSAPMRAPFSATERFITSTAGTSKTVTTASTQKTSK